VAKIVNERGELDFRTRVGEGRDLERQLLVVGIESLRDDSTDIGDILIPILDRSPNRDRSVELQRYECAARHDANRVSEHRCGLGDTRGGFEDGVGLARYEICECFGVIRIRGWWIDTHHVVCLRHDVSTGCKRVSECVELDARDEHVDIDSGAKSTVITDGDSSNERVIRADLVEDLGELGKGSGAIVQRLKWMIRDAERGHTMTVAHRDRQVGS